MQTKYPNGMSYRQWRATPFRVKHRLIGLALNDRLKYWRDCADSRCRRARTCQDHRCYWRRAAELPLEEKMRLRDLVKPLTKLLGIGSNQGSEGMWLY